MQLKKLSVYLNIGTLYFTEFDIRISEPLVGILFSRSNDDRFVRTCVDTGQTKFAVAFGNGAFGLDFVVRPRADFCTDAAGNALVGDRKPFFGFGVNAVGSEWT